MSWHWLADSSPERSSKLARRGTTTKTTRRAVDDRVFALAQRRDYLTERIAAKQKVGYDTEWDERERNACAWAVEQLDKESQ